MDAAPGQVGSPPRWHAAVAYTADLGVRATAPDPRGLLEEAAAALVELSADVSHAKRRRPEAFEVRADDLPALTYAWLNELVGLADARGEALVKARVEDLKSTPDGWLARGTAGFAAYDADVRPRLQVKAARALSRPRDLVPGLRAGLRRGGPRPPPARRRNRTGGRMSASFPLAGGRRPHAER